MNLSCFSLFRGYSYTITLSNVGKLNWSLIFLQTCPSSEREINFGHLIVMQKISDVNQVMSFDVFDAGNTWMHMLDGKANSHLQ